MGMYIKPSMKNRYDKPENRNTKNVPLFPPELLESMIQTEICDCNEARRILNAKVKGNFSDIIREIRDE